MLDYMSINEKYNIIMNKIDYKNSRQVDEFKKIISSYSIYNDISELDTEKLFNNSIEKGVQNEG